MSFVTFVAHTQETNPHGWPLHVQGDGFIDLELKYSDSEIEAVYVDQFRDEYQFMDSSAREWDIYVEED